MNARVLLVDNDKRILRSTTRLFESGGFEISTASSVPEAINKIASQKYDVLLSDLDMPGPGDGLTVVSAMRHANPSSVTLLLNAYPEEDRTADAVLLLADEVVVKSVDAPNLVETIQRQLTGTRTPFRAVESVGDILHRETDTVLARWFKAVEANHALVSVKLDFAGRTAYLALILSDLVDRLHSREPLGMLRPRSLASYEHGGERYRQGYTTEMIVEESRFLQVCIFEALQRNLTRLDFSVVLYDVMVIADEIDSQLGTMMRGYDSAPLESMRIA